MRHHPVAPDPREPTIRHRNRVLTMILVLVMLGMAIGGTMFLRHYGFNTNPHSERYH